MTLKEMAQIEARELGRKTASLRCGQGLPHHESERPWFGWAQDICPLCGKEVPQLRKHMRVDHPRKVADNAD